MVYDISTSKFLDKINRACKQFNLEKCKKYKDEFSLAKIEEEVAKELGLEDIKCIGNSRSFLDTKWSTIFRSYDVAFITKYDNEKKRIWDVKTNQANENKRFINSKLNELKDKLAIDDTDEGEQLDKTFEVIKPIFTQASQDEVNSIRDSLRGKTKAGVIANQERVKKELLALHDKISQEHINFLRENFIVAQHSDLKQQLGLTIKKDIKSVCNVGSIIIPKVINDEITDTAGNVVSNDIDKDL